MRLPPKLSPKKFMQLALKAKFLQRLRINKKERVSKLPEELLLYIFEFLSIQSLCSVVSVNTTWRDIGFDGYLWKTQSLNYFETPINRLARRLADKREDEDWKGYFRRRYQACEPWVSPGSSLLQTTITGHVGTVWTLAFDDNKLVTGSFDKTIKVSSNPLFFLQERAGHSFLVTWWLTMC